MRHSGRLLEILDKAYEGPACDEKDFNLKFVVTGVAQYENKLREKPFGQPFPELYNLKTLQPKPEWQDMYDKAQEQVSAWGLAIP